ncbi:hypothetical protein MTR67_002476 [Solanum verrucosum]|uniref:Uncharacterized protein n=1 Tax=Solanum verrucosum TaxID=315347 RepID=A0AAF0PQY0_SOLVR|nr:hypothetical protein MTR67_002476 [Solanum verrucosum]
MKNPRDPCPTDRSASLIEITDQLGDSPLDVVHRRFLLAFNIVVLWVIGRYGIASRNFLVMHDCSLFPLT